MAAALRDLQALVERAGGRQRVLLVGEAGEGEEAAAPRALLEGFARDLFAERGERRAAAGAPVARRVRVRLGGGGASGRVRGRPWLASALLFVLFRASSLRAPRWRRERPRLREILRDLRGQLPPRRAAAAAPAPPAVVGVVVADAGAGEGHACCGGAPAERPDDEEARLRLEALLRRVFRARRPGHLDTLQAATYRPGGAGGAAEVRGAACRALRAALKLRADEAETKKRRLPGFLRCLWWGRRTQRKGRLGAAAKKHQEGVLHELNEGLALSNVTPNGNCEDGSGGAECLAEPPTDAAPGQRKQPHLLSEAEESGRGIL